MPAEPDGPTGDCQPERDLISDRGLELMEAFVDKIPQNFDLTNVQVRAKSVTVTLRFDAIADVLGMAEKIPNIFEAAMWFEALVKNLRHARGDRSPHAGKGGYVPSGVKAPIDEAAARRAAFEDLDPGVFE